MVYEIQIASADDVGDRYDSNPDSVGWEHLVGADSYKTLLEYLLQAANGDDFTLHNCWLRLVTQSAHYEVTNF